MNARLQSVRADRGLPPTAFRITEDQTARIRALRAELFGRWNAVPPGEALELSFERPAESAA
jgi:hypothetical protein